MQLYFLSTGSFQAMYRILFEPDNEFCGSLTRSTTVFE